MIWPASLTAIRSSIEVGWTAKAAALSPESTRFFNSPRPTDAADEIDARIEARIADAEDGFEQQARQQPDIEAGRDIVAGRRDGARRQAIPAAVHIETELAGLARTGFAVDGLDLADLLDVLEEFGRGQAVEIGDDPVVVEDPHFVGREDDGQEGFVPLGAGRGRIGGAAGLGDPDGGIGAVMAVGDVERLLGLESIGQGAQGPGIGHCPDGVTDPVQGHVEIGFAAGRLGGEDFADALAGAVGDHHRAGMSADGLDLPNPVILLGRTGEFVAADAAAVIGRYRSPANDTGLDMIAHGQAIDVEAGGLLAHQHALVDHAADVFGALGVDLGGVGIGVRRQIDFGLRDVQEAPRPALGHSPCLLGVDHVIGRGDDIAGAAGGGTKGGERTQKRQGHNDLPSSVRDSRRRAGNR